MPYRTIEGQTYVLLDEAMDVTWETLQQELDRRMHGDVRIKGYKVYVLRWLLDHNKYDGEIAKTAEIERDLKLSPGALRRPVASLAKQLLIKTFRHAYGGITLTAKGVKATKSLPPDTSY